MVKFFTMLKEGEYIEKYIINDLKPGYKNGDFVFDYEHYQDLDCFETNRNIYNGGRFHKPSYYTDSLKKSRNYNLIEIKIYKNGSYKIFNHGNKYRYSKAPIN